MTRAFLALIARDLRLAARVGGSGGLGLVFFLMIVTIVPFALGPDLNVLAREIVEDLEAALGCSRPTRRTAPSTFCARARCRSSSSSWRRRSPIG